MIRFVYLLVISLLVFSIGYLPRFVTTKSEPVLNIFVWGDFFPEKTFTQFTEESGIPVNVHYYTSNEELILKLEKTRGAGYDLIFPSDYAVPILREKDLLKPLDKHRLSCLDAITPDLLNRPFDPNNHFSLPYFWEIYGVTWEGDLAPLFSGAHKVVMVQDPVEAFSLAAHHLGSFDGALSLLKKQRQFVEAYTDHKAHYLLATDDPPLAVLRSSFFFKHEDLIQQFYPPKNSTFATIENIALSTSAEHVAEAYQFIEFIYRPEIMALQIDKGPLFPACLEALSYTTFPLSKRYYELLESLSIGDLYFFQAPKETVRPLWVEVQTS